MNPLNPRHLSPSERRAELCRILALGLVRLHQREFEKATEPELSTLHNPAVQSGTAPPKRRTS